MRQSARTIDPNTAEHKCSVRLVMEFDHAGLTPRELRQRFAEELRDAVAGLLGDADEAVIAELWRVAPNPERV